VPRRGDRNEEGLLFWARRKGKEYWVTDNQYRLLRESHNSSNRRYQQRTPREKKLFKAARQRARCSGREFTLSLKDIVIPPICPVLGIPMLRPSIDRVDSTRGYTPDNIEIISWEANKFKNNMTPEQMAQLALYYAPHLVVPAG
jgi:hypothetical protein